MRTVLRVFILLAVVGVSSSWAYEPREGDILFQTSTSSQSLAIQLVTKSPYTHCGILQIRNGKAMVLEAIGPVCLTPMEEWIARGKEGTVWIKRLENASARLTPEAISAMRAVGKEYMGRAYDHLFEWSDKTIYCSELVWKVYHRALGVDLGELQPFGNFDLSSPEARRIAKQRWGGMPPGDQKLITPAAIAECPKLSEVYSR